MTSADSTSLPYYEPGIVTILILTSFLLLSNILDYALNRLVYCGLIGQILIGIAWGAPGGKWLSHSIEEAIVQFGYLGLILLVYEGGLSTNFQSLKANLWISVFVAITGIGVPIGLSFVLGSLANVTTLQSFAAGAALCSTSLGTTFTVLGTTGLLKTRLGVVLTSAAMLDDVVGLVMVQVINNLGGASGGFSAVTVVRPVFVSLGFAMLCPLVCWLILKPVVLRFNGIRKMNKDGRLNKLLLQDKLLFGLHCALLIGMVTGASYAGTSNLFAAYIAGAIISWADTELPGVAPTELNTASETTTNLENQIPISGTAIYEKYFLPANQYILKPFFFASVGFSIPISRMFNGTVVWKGVIYTILMLIGKLLCGAWLIRFSLSLSQPAILRRVVAAMKTVHVPHLWGKRKSSAPSISEKNNSNHDTRTDDTTPPTMTVPETTVNDTDSINTSPISSAPSPPTQPSSPNTSPSPKNPLSLYPAAILGLAMVARGEIGFLISALAESNGMFSVDGNESLFLIVTWAIVLCTLIGPVCVGVLVRRVKKLEKERGVGARDVLGVWGVG